jgi:catechol 2,3-dioxygenase-like lactoylglutathione lyase family enzyme
MKASLEVVILPVADPDRSLLFYRDQVGFDLDVDYAPTPDFRVVQLTPEGSSTSIQFGVGLTDARAGSVRGLYLVVTDIEGCRSELTDRGVAVSDIRHKDADGGWRGDFSPAATLATLTMRVLPIFAIPTATPGCCKNAATRRPSSK